MNATIPRLKRADDPLRLVVEAAPYAMAVIDSEARIVLANAHLETLFGYSRGELQGAFLEVLAPELGVAHSGPLRGFIKELRSRFFKPDTDLRGRRADGSRFQVEIRWNPVHTAEGTWVLASILDASEGKRAERPDEAAFGRQKLESLGLLAGGLAHDFNNMQSGIIALSEIVLEDPNLDAGVAEELRKIHQIAIRGSEIVHELMVYAGEDEAELGLVDVSSLIGEMRELLHVSISRRAILKTHLAEGLLPVLANATHIRQVLMNLVVNASESIGEDGGTIEVSTSRARSGARDYLLLVVSDTGCGMTKQLQRRIFDPFFTTKVSGRGLGLAVVQGIVHRYGGALEIESAPGKGTRFEILFPCARQRAPQLAGA